MEKITDVTLPHGIEQIIKTDLLSMIEGAANPYEIIYHLAKYLESSSGENGYADYVLEQMRVVYGFALQEKKLLQDEYDEVAVRCRRIQAAYEDGDFTTEEKQRMKFSLDLHQKNLTRLQKLIHQAETKQREPYLTTDERICGKESETKHDEGEA